MGFCKNSLDKWLWLKDLAAGVVFIDRPVVGLMLQGHPHGWQRASGGLLYSALDRSMVTVHPCLCALSRRMSPPIARAKSRDIESPSPTPGYSLVVPVCP